MERYLDRIINGDSYLVMEEMIQNKITVDLFITDPPYNISDKNKLTVVGQQAKSTKEAWGNQFKDEWNSIEEYSDWLLERVSMMYKLLSKDGQIIIFIDRNYSGLFIREIEKSTDFIFRNKLYFEKNNPLPHFRKTNYRSTIEEAMWFTKSKDYTFNFGEQSDMKQLFKGNIGKKDTTHPTEKYKWMIYPIILNHSKDGDVILDPFAGSGTTAICCKELKRHYIAIELNKEFFDLIINRQNESCNLLF